MTKLFPALLLFAVALAACDSFSKKSDNGLYGQGFDTTGAVSALQLVSQAQPGESNALVKGTITSSCKSEGCWLKLDAGNGQELFVSTEDEFFIPKEGMQGKTVYVKGITSADTTTVENLKRLAYDEGKTESEIARITEPKIEVTVQATGVKVL